MGSTSDASAFLGANYVYSLWFARASMAEIWVYCLMPWVVASALSPITGRWLAIFLFLQVGQLRVKIEGFAANEGDKLFGTAFGMKPVISQFDIGAIHA